ncbi:MAG: 23S rRNA (pseudouridine(1915)-N(3))-methyltransferase RlmH [Oscillospiraceae bacterium]|jgi:23S rRNA (pseudouridine1915-N3)-methyltransferase|nr:23S rRNA (pseudouridine(1915)-N(3))-methyltransferase RlmH [Oscillospiraceae bacterium]
MAGITFICAGRVKEAYYKAAVSEYTKRISGFCRTEFIELRESMPENGSPAAVKKALGREAEDILRKIPADAFVLVCDVAGSEVSSETLASELKAALDTRGNIELAVVIGSSNGLSDDVRQRADRLLCFSKMTFAHGLACVMACEQVYRALAIINNIKYHK